MQSGSILAVKPGQSPVPDHPAAFSTGCERDNVLRVVRTGGNLPEDRESLYWLNIKAIPSSKHVEGVNTLQIAINTRIKLLYRPSAVKGRPEDVADKLEWHREGNDLVVNNRTPFYMNFQTLTLNGQKVKSHRAVPKTETHFALRQRRRFYRRVFHYYRLRQHQSDMV